MNDNEEAWQARDGRQQERGQHCLVFANSRVIPLKLAVEVPEAARENEVTASVKDVCQNK